MNKPHKHAELIKAWADGAEIERRYSKDCWQLVTNPLWDEDAEYRIKKNVVKTVGYRRYYYKANSGEMYVCVVGESVHPLTLTFLEESEGFAGWKDTEFQYDEVEV